MNNIKEPTRHYVLAWICFFGMTNLFGLGVAMLFHEYLVDERISIETYLTIVQTSPALFLPISAFLVYEKVFTNLNLYTVYRWLLFLGTFLTMSNTGNSLDEIEELVGHENHIFYAYTPLVIWIIFLFVFRYYFKTIKGHAWNKTKG